MSFFVTSVGPGKGGNLGGLAGADRQCQQLAQAAGAGGQDLACLSVDARVRRGERARSHRQRTVAERQGRVVATSVDDLHSDNNKINKQDSLSEKGEEINGYGDKPNRHDILTGSKSDGTAFTDDADHTCKNYTSSTQGSVMLGHSDRNGPATFSTVKSRNSAHPSRGPDGGSAVRPTCVRPAATGFCTASR